MAAHRESNPAKCAICMLRNRQSTENNGAIQVCCTWLFQGGILFFSNQWPVDKHKNPTTKQASKSQPLNSVGAGYAKEQRAVSTNNKKAVMLPSHVCMRI